MDRLWLGIGIGLGVLFVPGGSLILLAWLLRGDGNRYAIKCLTCGAHSGDRRYQWVATRWATWHAKKNPACASRTMTGNRKPAQ